MFGLSDREVGMLVRARSLKSVDVRSVQGGSHSTRADDVGIVRLRLELDNGNMVVELADQTLDDLRDYFLMERTIQKELCAELLRILQQDARTVVKSEWR